MIPSLARKQDASPEFHFQVMPSCSMSDSFRTPLLVNQHENEVAEVIPQAIPLTIRLTEDLLALSFFEEHLRISLDSTSFHALRPRAARVPLGTVAL